MLWHPLDDETSWPRMGHEFQHLHDEHITWKWSKSLLIKKIPKLYQEVVVHFHVSESEGEMTI